MAEFYQKGLNKNDYEDFSAVTDAVNAVEYDKDYTEQETVEGHAKAIEKAIKALKLRSADYTAVDEALTKVKGLDAGLYRNFSDVTAAVDWSSRYCRCMYYIVHCIGGFFPHVDGL